MNTSLTFYYGPGGPLPDLKVRTENAAVARQIEDDAMSDPVHTWSISTVGSFLHRTGLGSFAEVFMACKVSGSRLVKLTDAELEAELGMVSSKQRRALLYDVNSWRIKNDPITRAKAAQKAAADQVPRSFTLLESWIVWLCQLPHASREVVTYDESLSLSTCLCVTLQLAASMTSPKQRGKPGALVAAPSSAAGPRPHTGGQRGTKAVGSPKRPLPHATGVQARRGSAVVGGAPPHVMIAKRVPLRIVEALDMDVDRPRSVSPTTSD